MRVILDLLILIGVSAVALAYCVWVIVDMAT